MGGLLLLPSFVATFPEIDTTKAMMETLTPQEQTHRTNIQGAFSLCGFSSDGLWTFC
jgi:hypothetical protein